MTYTLGTLRRLGLENEFRELVKRYIPKTTNDQEAARYIEAVIAVAEKEGLVGTAMMRQMAHMRINQAVEPGLYGEIIKLHKRAAEGMRKKADQEEEHGSVGDTTEDVEEAVEAPESEEAEEAEEAEDEDERDGEEEDSGGPEEEERGEAAEEEGDEGEVGKYEFEGISYRAAPHPLKPKALAKYGDDFLFPVPPERLWTYKTALYKSFLALAAEPRTLKKHFRSCSRRGVTKAQFDKAMKFWEKEGKKIGWMLVEINSDEVQLQPMKPIA